MFLNCADAVDLYGKRFSSIEEADIVNVLSVTYFYYFKEILNVKKSAQAFWNPIKEQNLS